MELKWRREPIRSHAEWVEKISAKDDQPDRSAPTLATAWSGPLELFSALSGHPVFADLTLESLSIEAQTPFDEFGGPRNHDLLLVGSAAGGRVVISIEAKAGESFGQTVGRYRADALRKRARGENTNAPERLDALLEQFGLRGPSETVVDRIGYQLLSGMAGAIAAGRDESADHVVFFVHDFITDARLPAGDEDLKVFARAAFARELPPDHELPWCIELPAVGSGPALYLARAATDIRSRLDRSA